MSEATTIDSGNNPAPAKVAAKPKGKADKKAKAESSFFTPSIKPFKKKLFITLTKTFGYYKKVNWHATNIGEKNDIIANFGEQSRIKIASNISLCVITKKEIIKSKNNLNLVFFSRISPKKNLFYALQLLIGLKNIRLDIYGSIEDHVYWDKCNQLIKDRNINASYKGEILPVNVTLALGST